jgi:hypothetical protein
MARHSPSARSFLLLCRCGFFADADAIPSLQHGGLTFLLWRDSSASPSAETTRRRRWRAPQFAPPHDSRARAEALPPLHPSACARFGASPPLPPLRARDRVACWGVRKIGWSPRTQKFRTLITQVTKAAERRLGISESMHSPQKL